MTTNPGFLGFPDTLPDGQKPRIVIFGAPYGTEYQGKDSSGYAAAAANIRAAVAEDAALIENWDFDLGGPLFDGQVPSCIDTGDLPTRVRDNEGNRELITAKTREILSAGAVPIMIGGDDSTPIPFFAGFSESDPVWILQIDAHIDWRDELHGGERFGYSSPMRRASEMAHVAGIVQVGMRGLGSARIQELEDAQRYGAKIVTAREIHAQGITSAIRHIPEGARILITLDCDGLDPSIMPGVVAPTPGGLNYTQVIELIEAAAARGGIAGFDLVEFHTPSDIGGLTALTAARILVNAIGRILRQA
jgi:agmatinase